MWAFLSSSSESAVQEGWRGTAADIQTRASSREGLLNDGEVQRRAVLEKQRYFRQGQGQCIQGGPVECGHPYQLLNNGHIASDNGQPSLLYLERSSEQHPRFPRMKSLALVYPHIGSY